jgi:hypothetical protein
MEFNRIKEEQTNLEMQQCTFHPNINHTTTQQTATPVVDRYATYTIPSISTFILILHTGSMLIINQNSAHGNKKDKGRKMKRLNVHALLNHKPTSVIPSAHQPPHVPVLHQLLLHIQRTHPLPRTHTHSHPL